MGIFHPARILEVYSPKDANVLSADSITLATIETWDGFQFTLPAEAEIAKDIKNGDIVLIDYTSKAPTAPIPRQIIVKVLRGDKAKKIWKLYSDYHKRKKSAPKHPQQQATPGYFG